MRAGSRRMVFVISLLGIPNDENSSSKRGSADGPPLIRRELFSDRYMSWS